MIPDEARERILSRLKQEIAAPVSWEIQAFALDVARHYGAAVAGIVFYGACLRERRNDGLLDFYVLLDDYRTASLSAMAATATRLLPPTIHHRSFTIKDRVLQAKVAIISLDQWRRRMTANGRDTTLWARFCQPVALVYAREAAATEAVLAGLADAVLTAALWAARLGPPGGTPRGYWRTLFDATYRAELRVEGEQRSAQLWAAAPARYAVLLSDAWRELGIPDDGIPNSSRFRHHAAWRRRQRVGKLLNLARLIKAAFTYEGGATYIVSKIERHASRPVELSRFQRRHPMLAAPSLLWQLIRHRTAR